MYLTVDETDHDITVKYFYTGKDGKGSYQHINKWELTAAGEDTTDGLIATQVVVGLRKLANRIEAHSETQ